MNLNRKKKIRKLLGLINPGEKNELLLKNLEDEIATLGRSLTQQPKEEIGGRLQEIKDILGKFPALFEEVKKKPTNPRRS